jgi:hypothetical protein
MPQAWEPKDWAEEQAKRIAAEVIRLRGSRSAQWLSDRTHELGYRVSRSVIADLENGRRRYVTTAEVIILALALETAPIALMYPGPYFDKMTRLSPHSPESPEIIAVEWFSGLLDLPADVPLDDDGRVIEMGMLAEMNYYERTRLLRVARRVRELDSRRNDALREIGLKRGKASDEEIEGLLATADDLKRQIDAVQAPRRDFFDEHPQLRPKGGHSGG